MTLKTACLFLFGAAAMTAQSTSSVTGQVVDATGAAIPNAKVVVRAIDTGVENTTRTNAEGYYTAPSLPPVMYQVTAEFEGFSMATSEPFKLDASSIARVDLKLSPKGSTQSIEIVDHVPLVQTESGTGGHDGGRAGIQEHAAERAQHDRARVHGARRACGSGIEQR